jgi:hypothetical protein
MLTIAAYLLGAVVSLLVARGHLNPGAILLCMALVCSIELFLRIED